MSSATLHTSHGAIGVELFPEDAPKTVDNFRTLAADGFYDGVAFHRVIPDFMIQGGDPTGTGSGGPGYTFEDEPNEHRVERGVLAMANAGPNTNGSQFFIVTATACPWLDGKHTVFGRVTSGMDVVDAISAVQTDASDRPREHGQLDRSPHDSEPQSCALGADDHQRVARPGPQPRAEVESRADSDQRHARSEEADPHAERRVREPLDRTDRGQRLDVRADEERVRGRTDPDPCAEEPGDRDDGEADADVRGPERERRMPRDPLVEGVPGRQAELRLELEDDRDREEEEPEDEPGEPRDGPAAKARWSVHRRPR
jgi:cyclophilin family peptidyl-prolyl cis-trans isomerase